MIFNNRLINIWLRDTFCFIFFQTTTRLLIEQNRKPFSLIEQKIQYKLQKTGYINLFITIPLALGFKTILLSCNTRPPIFTQEYQVVICSIFFIETLHYILHYACHIKGWIGYELHKYHHRKDCSLPWSALSNHPIDLFVTVFVPPILVLYFIRRPVETFEPMLLIFIPVIGTCVHSKYWVWFLDIHTIHHSNSTFNFNGYIPINDIIFNTFKMPIKY